MRDIIQKGGLIVNKSDLSKIDVAAIKTCLTFEVKQSEFAPSKQKDYVFGYSENDTTLTVPRQFPISGNRIVHTSPGRDVVFTDKIILRNEKQERFYSSVWKELSEGRDAYGVAGTGTGKTCMCLKLLASLGKSAAIVVHKDFLMRQWRDRINEFLPGTKIGYCQQNKCNTGKDYDIVLCMVQSLACRDYGEEFYNSFGIVVYDEAHRQASKHWNSSIYKFNPKQFLMVSATPERNDGMEVLQYMQVAEPCIIIKQPDLLPRIETRNTGCKYPLSSYQKWGKTIWPYLTDCIVKDDRRNSLIVKDIVSAAKKEREILVISERLEQLDTLAAKVTEILPDVSVGFYIGGKKEAALSEASAAQVVFTTYSMASEGFDCPGLDVLVIASPRSNMIQPVGRILRQYMNKSCPVVVDYQDAVPELLGVGTKRRRIFRENNFDVRPLR